MTIVQFIVFFSAIAAFAAATAVLPSKLLNETNPRGCVIEYPDYSVLNNAGKIQYSQVRCQGFSSLFISSTVNQNTVGEWRTYCSQLCQDTPNCESFSKIFVDTNQYFCRLYGCSPLDLDEDGFAFATSGATADDRSGWFTEGTSCYPAIANDSIALGYSMELEAPYVYCDTPWYFKNNSASFPTKPGADNCLPITGATAPYLAGIAVYNAAETEEFGVIPAGYELDTTRWCSVKQRFCDTANAIYRKDLTSDGDCFLGSQLNFEPRAVFGYCLRRIAPTPPTVPTPEPTAMPLSFENRRSAAFGGYIDPDTRPLAFCDSEWSYRRDGSAETISVTALYADNCLPINQATDTYGNTFTPFGYVFPFTNFAYPSDGERATYDAAATAAADIPEGYEIDLLRWCSRRQQVCTGPNDPTPSSVYRRDANVDEEYCTAEQKQRAWGYCLKRITNAPTLVPTTLAPTRNPTTLAPTRNPTTLAPTRTPTTLAPTDTTAAPTTRTPTTDATASPTDATPAPTTRNPTTTTAPTSDTTPSAAPIPTASTPAPAPAATEGLSAGFIAGVVAAVIAFVGIYYYAFKYIQRQQAGGRSPGILNDDDEEFI